MIADVAPSSEETRTNSAVPNKPVLLTATNGGAEYSPGSLRRQTGQPLGREQRAVGRSEACEQRATSQRATRQTRARVVKVEASQLLEPWVPVGASGSAFEHELAKELAPSHALFGVKLRAWARREDQDDVLFVSDEPPVVVAVVHLTWRGHSETDTRWPHVKVFRSVDEWFTTAMVTDHHQFKDGAGYLGGS